MDFLANLTKSDESKPASADPEQHQKPSTTELFSSAKLVADAAQAHFRKEPAETYDKGKVATAAADLIDCASDYGKLDANQGIGKYVDQAEDYLRHYGTPPHTTTATAAAATTISESGEEKTATVATATTVVGHEEPEKVPEKEPAAGGGGADYVKMAEGFFNKPSGGGSGEGGAGDFMKLAGDFLKK